MITIKVKQLEHGIDLAIPSTATTGSAGFDLQAAIPQDADVRLKAGGYTLVPTALMLQIPKGYEGQVRPRSGLALKHGVTVLNSPGTIDSDYRGEVQVILINHGETEFVISRGMRIAQLVIAPCLDVSFQMALELETSERGEGGFGSSGLYRVASNS